MLVKIGRRKFNGNFSTVNSKVQGLWFGSHSLVIWEVGNFPKGVPLRKKLSRLNSGLEPLELKG